MNQNRGPSPPVSRSNSTDLRSPLPTPSTYTTRKTKQNPTLPNPEAWSSHPTCERDRFPRFFGAPWCRRLLEQGHLSGWTAAVAGRSVLLATGGATVDPLLEIDCI